MSKNGIREYYGAISGYDVYMLCRSRYMSGHVVHQSEKIIFLKRNRIFTNDALNM